MWNVFLSQVFRKATCTKRSWERAYSSIGRQAGYYAARSFPFFEKKAQPEDDPTKLKTHAFQEGFWSEAGRAAYREGRRRVARV